MDRHNLTVLTGALVTRVLFDGKRAVGIEFLCGGQTHRIGARCEIVLSLGAINTPKLLMQSGIGDESELTSVVPPRNNAGEVNFFWKSGPSLDTPDLQSFQVEIPVCTPETAHFSPPAASWSMLPGVVRPRSRGHLRITGPNPSDPIEIVANTFSDPADMEALIRSVELCREIGNSAVLSPFVKREVMPGNLAGDALESLVRDATSAFWHQTCTAKMGRDEMSVVDSKLQVYGIDNLRIADGSIMPRVTTGNTMASCVIIGEKAVEFLKEKQAL
jgi:choline dehydrogenase